jgi:hypothetical protein
MNNNKNSFFPLGFRESHGYTCDSLPYSDSVPLFNIARMALDESLTASKPLSCFGASI